TIPSMPLITVRAQPGCRATTLGTYRVLTRLTPLGRARAGGGATAPGAALPLAAPGAAPGLGSDSVAITSALAAPMSPAKSAGTTNLEFELSANLAKFLSCQKASTSGVALP